MYSYIRQWGINWKEIRRDLSERVQSASRPLKKFSSRTSYSLSSGNFLSSFSGGMRAPLLGINVVSPVITTSHPFRRLEGHCISSTGIPPSLATFLRFLRLLAKIPVYSFHRYWATVTAYRETNEIVFFRQVAFNLRRRLTQSKRKKLFSHRTEMAFSFREHETIFI